MFIMFMIFMNITCSLIIEPLFLIIISHIDITLYEWYGWYKPSKFSGGIFQALLYDCCGDMNAYKVIILLNV